MNNRRGLFILLVVFIVLAGIVLLQPNLGDLISRQDAPTPTPEQTAAFIRVFPDLDAADIQAIQLLNPISNDTLTISQMGDGAWTTTDFAGALDQAAAANIAQTVALLIYTYTTPVTADGDLEQFGFRPYGDFLIAVLMDDGSSHAIAVGAPLQTGPEFYACVDDSCTGENARVYLLQRSPIDYLVGFLQTPPVSP